MNTTKSVRRFDYGEITSVEKTPQGFLRVPGFATRVGVFIYMDSNGQVRRELRHPDDVFAPESLATLRNCPVTLEHPPTMLTPSNVKQYMQGYTTDRVEVNRDLVETDLIIAGKDAIEAVEDDGVRELSSGYTADLVEEKGSYNGALYDVIQKNIEYNHLAIVKRGRAGPEARLRMDSLDADQMGGMPITPINETSEMKEIVIGGQTVSLPLQQANVISDLLDRYDEMRGKTAKQNEGVITMDEMKKDEDVNQKGISPQIPVVQAAEDGRTASSKVMGDKRQDDEKDEDKKDAEVPPVATKGDDDDTAAADPSGMTELKKDLTTLQNAIDAVMAKVDAKMTPAAPAEPAVPAPAKGANMDAADVRLVIKNRVKLERAAEKLLPSQIIERFDSMTDDQIRIQAIKHNSPKADLVGKSPIYIQTRFDAMVEQIDESLETRKSVGKSLLSARMDSEENDPTAKRAQMIADSRNLWKQTK